MEAGIKFVVGQEYFYRFTCDHDTKAYMTVVSRTDKSIVVQESGERKPRRIKLREWDGVEQAYAANYSMAGVWSANKLSDRAPKASVEATAAPEPEALANCIPFPSKAPTASPEPLPSLSRGPTHHGPADRNRPDRGHPGPGPLEDAGDVARGHRRREGGVEIPHFPP
jgi:hypothetical protein